VISGKLPNNTIWWLSTNGQKIWIESKDLEQDKFKEKGYRVTNDRIFHTTMDIGELTTSRLQSRRHKDAWIIKLGAVLDVYPELIEEIKRKEIEEKNKKRTRIVKKAYRIGTTREEHHNDDIIEGNNAEPDNNQNNDHTNYFDIDRPYVTWIKDEIDKSEKGEIIISLKELKNKMGEEFEEMNDFRIFFGLNKILSNIGIKVEWIGVKREIMVTIRRI
jgi:hypothetical protein